MASYRKMAERLMTEAQAIARERNTEINGEIVREAVGRIQNNGRKKAPPPPEGGISLREAQRKYGILHSTISRWVSRGYIPIIARTQNWLYIDEEELKKFLANPKTRRGRPKNSR